MPQYERDGVWYDVPTPEPLRTVVRSALLNALAYTNGRHDRAAALLGLSRFSLSYQMRLHGIPPSWIRTPKRMSRASDR